MGSRLKLHDVLLQICPNVYFQPPEDLKMTYPAIRYSRASDDVEFADNIPYTYDKRYQIIAIYKDPDSDLPDQIAHLPMCTSDRFYTVNNLHHASYFLYF